MSPGAPILLVESDRHFATALARELAADGHRVALAHTPEQASQCASRQPPRVVLLGQLPARQALKLLETARHALNRVSGTPAILVLGTEAGGLEALRAFEAGADDFIARPLNYLELRARLDALLRRTPPTGLTDKLAIGALRIDPRERRAFAAGRELDLTRIEFELLLHLARAPERIFTRQELLRSVWGFASDRTTRTLDTHASRLRRKLHDATARDWLPAVRGVGYRLI